MAKYVQNAAIPKGKRTRTATVAFVAAPAAKQQRDSRLIVLPRSRFTETWWQQHLSPTLTPAAPAVPDEQPIGTALVPMAQPGLKPKAKRALRTHEEQALDTAARIAALEAACGKVQQEFELSCTWEERKLIAAQSYYAERLAIAKENASMAQGEMRAVSIAARAAAVSYSTSRNWIADHVNNAGFFSPSMWGTNPKLASLCGDITVKRWARAWIIGHGQCRASVGTRANRTPEGKAQLETGKSQVADSRVV